MIFVTTWIDVEGIMPSEIVRERQVLSDFIYVWNLKRKIDPLLP